MWIALNYVSLKDWIQQISCKIRRHIVVNCFKLCIFERLNTTSVWWPLKIAWLWIALNYVSLKDWIQHLCCHFLVKIVVNCFKLCIFERLNTTIISTRDVPQWLWIALNYVSLKDWIQQSVQEIRSRYVVNCFKLCIFERLNTTIM